MLRGDVFGDDIRSSTLEQVRPRAVSEAEAYAQLMTSCEFSREYHLIGRGDAALIERCYVRARSSRRFRDLVEEALDDLCESDLADEPPSRFVWREEDGIGYQDGDLDEVEAAIETDPCQILARFEANKAYLATHAIAARYVAASPSRSQSRR